MKSSPHTNWRVAVLEAAFFALASTGVIAQTRSLQDFASLLTQQLSPTVIYTAREFITKDPNRPRAEAIALEVGKLADMVILSDNPLTIDPMKINTIRVMETIKEGKTVYTRK